jgi:acyl homoserine lactone synthase
MTRRRRLNMKSNGTVPSAATAVCIREGGFILKTLEGDDERSRGYRLRHTVFSEELGWVPRSESHMEKDEYDSHAIPIGILDAQKRMLAYSRTILPRRTFMIEKEFSRLVSPNHHIRKDDDTAEVSRLCVSSEARSTIVCSNLGTHSLSMLLYKGIYHWCAGNRIRYIYIVVDYKIYRLFWAKGFPCRPVGEPVTMPDGCIAVAAMVDFEELVALNTAKRPELMRWFLGRESWDLGPTPLGTEKVQELPLAGAASA